jgi:uncharacterized protein
MPTTVSYPGVYIEELPSGVHTISGVATSITAFVGWAGRGPTDRAQLVQSWTEFERIYGVGDSQGTIRGEDRRSLLGYSVHHFFNNGGQQAYIIRLVHTDAVPAAVSLPAGAGSLDFTASSPGKWANHYAIGITARSDDTTRFRVTVFQVSAAGLETPVESFENLSMDSADRRFVDTIVNSLSQFIRVAVTGGTTTPPANTSVTTPVGTSPKLSFDTAGVDGTVLAPDAANFEAALQAAGGAAGVNLLDRIDLFNLLCVPGETTVAVVSNLEAFCRRHRAFLIADCQQSDTFNSLQGGPNSAITGADAINAAFYFPWVNAPDLLQDGRPRAFPPCGFVAGLYAKTDAFRGVWKAPAGTEASLAGVSGLAEILTDAENGTLNLQAINCLRHFKIYGDVIWGARTLQGHNDRGSEWKYIPVRRVALFIEETLYRNTQWVVFEPNDEPLWAQIRLNIGAFMHGLFRQGAFQGMTPKDAYFVKCDKETTTQADINLGIVNIVVGFAPLKPAEFVIIKIQQMAGQIEV